MDKAGPWRLDRRLGAGGMGAVYLGRRRDGTQAAVKVIRDEFATDDAFRARFRREVEACTRVRGPRVAELLDADVDGSRMWLAVRYVPGPTLSAYVDEHGPLSPDAVRSLAIGLADALAVVWQAGIVHRDLKPSNVILTPDGPVLFDFGIAAAADATAITKTGAVLGTAGWMPPEQLRGAPTSAASDVWGWAALVTYAASGKGPFGEGPNEALAWRTLHQPPDAEALAPLPGPLAGLVARSLDTDPELRPASQDLPALAAGQTEDEATTIQATAAERDVLATRLWDLPHEHLQSADTPAPRFSRRGRWLTAAALGAALGLAVTLAIVLYQRSDNAPAVAATTSTTQLATPTAGPSSTASRSTSTSTATVAPTTTTPPLSAVETTDFANHSYELDCFGTELYDLVDGQYSDGEELGVSVWLIEVHMFDHTGDGRQEAVVELSCAAGASSVVSFAVAYEDVDGSLIRRGQALTTHGQLIRTGDTTFETYEPILGPGTSRCCPDEYEHTQWTIDFTTPTVIGPDGPPQIIPADEVPRLQDEDQST